MGMIHKNGDRLYGYASGYASDLSAAGTPNVSGLPTRHHTAEMQSVRIGDRLDIVLNGTHWDAERNGVTVGRMPFVVKNRGLPIPHFEGTRWDHDVGVLVVERLKVSAANTIANIGGTAYPIGHPALR